MLSATKHREGPASLCSLPILKIVKGALGMTDTEKNSNDGAAFVKGLREAFIKIRLRAKGIVNRIGSSTLCNSFREYDDARFSELWDAEKIDADEVLEELKRTREAAFALVNGIDELVEEILSRT